MTRDRVEGLVQVLILLLIGGMAGAASFTHVHDWTMHNTPHGTGDWFGWANAVISELTPTAAGLEVRRRKRTGQGVAYPMAVLAAAAVVSIAAQVAQAKPGPTGYLLAALPALAFLALTKLILSRTTPQPVERDVNQLGTASVPTVTVSTDRPALQSHHIPDPASSPDSPSGEIPAELLIQARMAARSHHRRTGQPITDAALAQQLGIPADLAALLTRRLGQEVSA